MSRIGKSIDTKSRLVVARGWREGNLGEMENDRNEYRVFGGVVKMF